MIYLMSFLVRWPWVLDGYNNYKGEEIKDGEKVNPDDPTD